MTLNELLTAIAKAGHSVSIEFDDGALLNHGYPFYVGVNGYSLINILSEYQEEIELSLLNKAEDSGGSFEYEYDKELKYSVREEVYNDFEVQQNENYVSITVQHQINNSDYMKEHSNMKPIECKIPLDNFPEWFELIIKEGNYSVDCPESTISNDVKKYLIKKLKKEVRSNYYQANFVSEVDLEDNGDFEIHYYLNEFDHAYNIEKGNGINFFESVELEELSEKEIEGLSKALEMTTEEFNKFLTTIEIEDE